ncbi:hypothetical protein K439DRAFT_229768 [Ramaria rubella]|nr:hypothetical protein K439DRAFT_229768 [Ramaria rubella]
MQERSLDSVACRSVTAFLRQRSLEAGAASSLSHRRLLIRYPDMRTRVIDICCSALSHLARFTSPAPHSRTPWEHPPRPAADSLSQCLPVSPPCLPCPASPRVIPPPIPRSNSPILNSLPCISHSLPYINTRYHPTGYQPAPWTRPIHSPLPTRPRPCHLLLLSSPHRPHHPPPSPYAPLRSPHPPPRPRAPPSQSHPASSPASSPSPSSPPSTSPSHLAHPTQSASVSSSGTGSLPAQA